MLTDGELAGVVTDNPPLTQKLVRLDAAPQRALGGDLYRVGGDGQRGDAKSRWCMNMPRVVPCLTFRVSDDPDGDRHAEPSHTVEDVASDLRLGPLIAQNPSVKTPSDDCFVSIHCGFDQAPAVVA